MGETFGLHELDVIELRHAVGRHSEGARGTIVSARDDDSYLVEFARNGKTLDIVEVDRLDVILVQRAADAARLT